MSYDGNNPQSHESFDVTAAARDQDGLRFEDNRLLWAERVEELQDRERALTSELGSVVQELSEARLKSAAAARRWRGES